MKFEVLEVKREEQKVGEGEVVAEGGLESLGLGFREVEAINWRDDISSPLESRYLYEEG